MKTNLPITRIEIDYPESAVFITRTDTRGVVTYANDSFVEISGFSREELVGENHNLVRHPDMPPWAFEDLWKTVKSGHPWRGLVKNRAKNGDHYWVRATVSPVTKDARTGRRAGALFSFRRLDGAAVPGNVVTAIKEISDQTNLLALNYDISAPGTCARGPEASRPEPTGLR